MRIKVDKLEHVSLLVQMPLLNYEKFGDKNIFTTYFFGIYVTPLHIKIILLNPIETIFMQTTFRRQHLILEGVN